MSSFPRVGNLSTVGSHVEVNQAHVLYYNQGKTFLVTIQFTQNVSIFPSHHSTVVATVATATEMLFL